MERHLLASAKIFNNGFIKFSAAKKRMLLICLMGSLSFTSLAQNVLTIEWGWTDESCARLPQEILILGSGNDGRIWKASNWNQPPGYTDYPSYASQKSLRVYGSFGGLRIAAGYKNDQGKCPGLSSGLSCFSGGLTPLNLNTT